MTSSEAFGVQLHKKLAADLRGLSAQRQKGEDTLADTEAALAELQASIATTRENTAAELASCEEEVSSIKAVQEIVTTFDSESVAMAREVKGTSELHSRGRLDSLSIRKRIELELTEAQSRVRAAKTRGEDLSKQMSLLTAEVDSREKSAAAELAKLSDDAVAARLKAQIGKRCFDVLQAELDRMNAEEADVRRCEEKRARADETRSVLEKEKKLLEEDDATIRRLGEREKVVQAEAAEAQAKALRMVEVFEAQLDAAKKLVQKQQEFLDSRLKPRQPTPTPTEARLLERAVEFARVQLAASQAEQRALEEEMGGHAEASAAAQEKRTLSLRQLRSQRQAVVVAHEHRERFVASKAQQLAAEVAEAEDGAHPFEGRESCIKMLRADMDESLKVRESLEHAAIAAEAARDGKAKAVADQRANGRAQLSALKVQIDCEASVREEQGRYVASLEEKLRQAALHAPAVDGMEGGLGQRGERIVDANAAAVSGLLAELSDELRQREAAHAAAVTAREGAEREAMAEERRLREQQVAMADAVAKLAEYEAELGAKIDALPPDVAQPSEGPPAPSSRSSHMVELSQTSQDAAATMPEAPAPPVDLRQLRLSAGEATEASLVIDRVARAVEAKPHRRSSYSSKGGRPESPVEVVSTLAVEQRE